METIFKHKRFVLGATSGPKRQIVFNDYKHRAWKIISFDEAMALINDCRRVSVRETAIHNHNIRAESIGWSVEEVGEVKQ
jgi:hypothetical protein